MILDPTLSGTAFLPRILALLVVLAACSGGARTVALDSLVLQDSLYLDPVTLEPFTGVVERYFEDDPGRLQLRGELLGGAWNGEVVVYHENGRVRYQGSLAGGAPCGAWVENRDSLPPEDVLAELKQEVESLGLYPECPDGG